MIFFWLEAMFTDKENENGRKCTSKRKKIEVKAWYRILGTEILSYKEFHCKTMQISEENKLDPAKWK